MKFLVIVQDLRVSGTSEGIVSRSFLGKLRTIYPEAIIDVLYLKHHPSDDDLHLLPVNFIKQKIVSTTIPNYIKWINRLSRRFFNHLYAENFIHKQYAKEIKKINYSLYDHIMIRSAGLAHETILATHNLPILKKSILIFHDPYPLAWYVGHKKAPTNLDFFRLKKTMEVVEQAKACASTANYMSHDLQNLYASKKEFHTLAHQFDASVFDLSDTCQVRKKSKKVSISYHGALMFGRNMFNVLLAYESLIKENSEYLEETEFVLRVKGEGVQELKEQFKSVPNIQILDTINFSNSSNEQIYESDIVIILENGPLYCNILVGKASFLAAYNKLVLTISPEKSELRTIITDERCVANMNDVVEIKNKLKNLIDNRLVSHAPFCSFGDYFSDENFKIMLEKILSDPN